MKKGLDSFQLKLIAVIAMVINHIGSGFDFSNKYPALFLFTEFVGKLTFPIMAFLLVEGFKHTSNVKKYALRLAVFALISVIPFHLYTKNNFDFQITDITNNVLFTLLIGLLMMICCEKVSNKGLNIIIVIIACILTINSDWAIFGILIIYGYYRISNKYKKVIFPVCYISLPIFLLSIFRGLPYINTDIKTFTMAISLGFTMLGLLLSIPVLLKYNGERGYSPKWVKYGYYIFYPAHLMILYIIRELLYM